MILHDITSSVRLRLMMVILTTTFIALFLSAAAVILYDAKSYQRIWVADLTTQADIIARTTAPALQFNDVSAAAENLDLLKGREKILAGAVYTVSGARFATYLPPQAGNAVVPDQPQAPGYQIEGNQIVVFHPIVEGGETIGTIFLRARYELAERVNNYLMLLAMVILGSMAIAALIASRLQRSITDPIIGITRVAHDVMHSRNFALRTPKTTNDEIGILADTLNGMLSEVEQRTNALEEANRTLAQETVTRRHAEAELLQMDKRKDEFLAMLAHELRNPLAPISAASQMLTLTQLNPERTKQVSEVIGRQVAHMTSLIDDLLDVSRVTRGMITLDRQPESINTILHEAVEQVRPLIDARRHELELELDAGAACVLGDRKRLVQVVTNVLNNAAKYTPERGRIRMSVSADSHNISIKVRDNGMGIEADLLPHVFELFTQARRSSDRALGGLGLGLALVKHLIELHGGSIAALSQGAGQGSEFTIILPRHHGEPETSSPAKPAAELRGQGGDPLNILIVDDNKDAVLTLATYMEANGHRIHCEYHPHAALATAAREAPDVCLLDIGLPDMDGYELVRQLRAAPQTVSALMVAITGYGQQKDQAMAMAAGFDIHLVKPVAPKDLLAVLERARSRPASADEGIKKGIKTDKAV